MAIFFGETMKLRGILILMLVALAAIANAQDSSFMGDAPVGARDVLDVRVLEDPTISATRVVVSEDGQIVLNVLGRVQVSGLTALEIEARLKSLLEARYLAKATVVVQVVEYASKPISVIGAVVRPGRINATGSTTLIQAITQAGGLSAGHGRELYVLRTGRNGLTEQVAVDIDDLMVAGNPDLNIPLAPNDLVNVPLDAPITIYIMGEVMHPGKAQFRSSQTPTLLQAIADAGGPTDRAKKTATIKRIENGKQRSIRVNYKRILEGRLDDVVLKDNDTVWIDEALF
jgi:polysaccharide export outer membrane protein